jgi:hypothetical protein
MCEHVAMVGLPPAASTASMPGRRRRFQIEEQHAFRFVFELCWDQIDLLAAMCRALGCQAGSSGLSDC